MRSWLRALVAAVAAVVAVLITLVPAADAVARTQGPLAYTYDGHHHSTNLTHTQNERGPPTYSDTPSKSPDAVDHLSHGHSARTDNLAACTATTYDDPVMLAQGAVATTMARGQVAATNADLCPVQRSQAAAKSLSALEQGAAKVPAEWGEGLANSKGVGTRWFDPANKGNGIRIDAAVPGSLFPSQQVDHVIVRSGGRILGPDGKPIVGSLNENPQAHIPLSDWLNWSSWNAP